MQRSTVLVRIILIASASLAGTRPAQALLTFERAPSGALPVDNAVLADPYNIDGGGTVRFFFDANLNNVFDPGSDILPVFEAIGRNPGDGFVSQHIGPNARDRARPGFEGQLGTFFLRQPDAIGTVPAPFLIAYETDQVIREFSGEIWDIDGGEEGTEQWRVDVLNGSGAVLATVTSPIGVNTGPNSLDSLPWNFALINLPDGVRSIRLTFIGSKTDGVGLAFNNFSPTVAVTAPEPSSVVLLGTGLLGLLAVARRVRRAA